MSFDSRHPFVPPLVDHFLGRFCFKWSPASRQAFVPLQHVPAKELTRSIVCLLGEVIKCLHSLPKLGLIAAAVQAVCPASCSSTFPTQPDSGAEDKDSHWRRSSSIGSKPNMNCGRFYFSFAHVALQSSDTVCELSVLGHSYGDTISPDAKRASCLQAW